MLGDRVDDSVEEALALVLGDGFTRQAVAPGWQAVPPGDEVFGGRAPSAMSGTWGKDDFCHLRKQLPHASSPAQLEPLPQQPGQPTGDRLPE